MSCIRTLICDKMIEAGIARFSLKNRGTSQLRNKFHDEIQRDPRHQVGAITCFLFFLFYI